MTKIYTVLVMASLLLTVGCSQKETQKPSAELQTQQRAEYVRPAAEGGNTAAYFTYQNQLDVADTLLSIQAESVGMAQVHETYETEDGMMGMREIKQLVVQPQKQAIFKQGGMHIMLMNVGSSLQLGDSLAIRLEWAEAGAVTIKLPVN